MFSEIRQRIYERVKSKKFQTFLPPLIFLLAFFVVPMIELIRLSVFSPGFTLEHLARAAFHPAYALALLQTILLSLAVSLSAAAIATPVSLFIKTLDRSKLSLFF